MQNDKEEESRKDDGFGIQSCTKDTGLYLIYLNEWPQHIFGNQYRFIKSKTTNTIIQTQWDKKKKLL